MLSKNRLSFLFLFFTISQLFTAAQLYGPSIEQSFFKTVDSLFDGYSIEVIRNTDTELKKMYKIKSSNEHIINISVQTKDKEKCQIGFTRSKKEDIFKLLPEFFTEEIEMQAESIKELVKRMAVVDVSGSDVLYYNMISDVRQKLVSLSGPQSKLSINQEFKDKKLIMQLFSQESLLGLFEISINSSQKPDFEILIDFTISHNNKQESSRVSVPMFSEDESSFNLAMNQISAKLELKKYINNNADNLHQFEAFLKENFKQIGYKFNSEQSNDFLKSFELKLEKQTARGEITYLPPQSGEKIGGYKFVIYRQEDIYSSVQYKRLSNINAQEEFKKLKIEGLFETLWEKIKRIYKASFSKILGKTFSGVSWKESVSKPFIWSDNEAILSLYYNSQSIMELGLTSSKAKIALRWSCSIPSINQMKYKFHPDETKEEILQNFFEMIFESYDWLNKKEVRKVVL